jgi:transposase
MSKAYSSNLTQWQWELIEAMIPPAKPGGRNREVEVWSVLNAIFYVLTQGCTWRNLPGDFPAWQTVYTYFRNWRKDRTWVAIHEKLRDWVRSGALRSGSPISDKLRRERSCQGGLSGWLKEKLPFPVYSFGEGVNNQFLEWFADGFNNSQILISGGRKIFNRVRC